MKGDMKGGWGRRRRREKKREVKVFILVIRGPPRYTQGHTLFPYTKLMLATLNSLNFWELYKEQLIILLGAICSVFLIIALAKACSPKNKLSTLTLILCGSIFSSFIQSFISLIRYYMIKMDPTDSRVSELQTFMLGSFNNIFSREHLLLIAVPLLLLLIAVFLLRGPINVLVFSEEDAKVMGIPTEAFKYLLICLATLLTAIPIAFCGSIGFIGLIVPHLSRYLVGPNYRTLLPTSALLGAVLMIAIYNLAYLFNASLYVNLFTSFIWRSEGVV